MQKCLNFRKELDSERVQSSLTKDALEKEWVKLAEISTEIDKLEALPNLIYREIIKLEDNLYQAVLIHRYLNDLTWEETAMMIGISLRWAKELGKRAEEELEGRLHDTALLDVLY